MMLCNLCCIHISNICAGVTPYGGTKCRWGGLKSVTFDKYLAISRKRCKIDAWFLLKSNRKSYALYRMVTLPMTLGDP